MSSMYSEFGCKKSKELEAALKELISDISERVIPVQDEEGKPWQVIRFEIWEDSGRIIAFPAMAGVEERIDIAGGQVVCTELAKSVELLDSSDLSDEAHEHKLVNIVHSIAFLVSALSREYGKFDFRVFDQNGSQIQSLNK